MCKHLSMLPILAATAATAATVPGVVPADDDHVGGPFDLIAGLPLHPLVVHAAVVLLPLAALGLVVAVAVPRWRGWLGWLSLAGLAVATGAVVMAKVSGEALAERVGEPERHAQLGSILVLWSGGLLVLATAWVLLARRDARRARSSVGTTILAVVTVVAALLTTGWVVLVGHSGAEAVWGGRFDPVAAAASVPAGQSSGSASGSSLSGAGATVPGAQ